MSAYVHPETCCWCVDSLRAERDALEVECQLQRNLLGNATGAALDVGLAGDVAAHDAIYLLAAERDALLSAIIGWQLAIGDELLIEQAENVLIGIARRGLGVTGGEPER